MNEWKEKMIYTSIGFVSSIVILVCLLVFKIYQEFPVQTSIIVFLTVPLSTRMFLDTLIERVASKSGKETK